MAMAGLAQRRRPLKRRRLERTIDNVCDLALRLKQTPADDDAAAPLLLRPSLLATETTVALDCTNGSAARHDSTRRVDDVASAPIVMLTVRTNEIVR
jgi:hypothetical protein